MIGGKYKNLYPQITKTNKNEEILRDVTLKGEDESAFVKVHDNAFLQAKHRIYMTATPRLYTGDTKKKAEENDPQPSTPHHQCISQVGEDYQVAAKGEL